MGAMKDTINLLKETLKDLVTADNTEAVARVQKVIDELEQKGDSLEAENLSLKDKVVDMVKGTLTTEQPPKDEATEDNKPLSFDEASDKAMEIVLNSRKK